MAEKVQASPNIRSDNPVATGYTTPSYASVEFQEVMRKDGFHVTNVLTGVMAADALNFKKFFVAPFACELIAAYFEWGAASTTGTVRIERTQGVTAAGSGDNVLAAALSTATAANTVNKPALTTTKTRRVLNPGDRLGLRSGGSQVGLDNLTCTVLLYPLGKGHYQNQYLT